MESIDELVTELCKREGLKKQTDMAQVKEIVGHFSDLLHENKPASMYLEQHGGLYGALLKNGEARHHARDKKAAKAKKESEE